jgi:hypothetical protein
MVVKKIKKCKNPKCKGHKHIGDRCLHKDGTSHKIHECKECK